VAPGTPPSGFYRLHLPALRPGYLVSRCRVWARQRGQNLRNSIRSGSFRLFLTVV